MNLLIVNDEIRTAEVLKQEIEWKQYGIDEVYTAYDSERGKKTVKERRIDIMLCDIEMPGESGLELLKWIRNQNLEVECIFLTCHANFEYAKEAISLGCQDYILVPAKYEDIGKAVHKVVHRILEKKEEKRIREYGEAYLQEKIKKKEKKEEKMSPDELVDAVKTYIMRNLGDSELSVTRIAENFFFHPVYLNRIFKQKQGLSVSQYLIDERMHMAGKLLCMSEMPTAQIAQQVGYTYYANFNNMFKRFYGCTPAQYQEAHRKK